MSDTFDHALDAELEQLDQDRMESNRELQFKYRSWHRSIPKITCKLCGQTGLIWVQVERHWTLYNSRTRVRHICPGDASQPEFWVE